MKLIIGLGNPGSKYDSTRHNIGRNTVIKLAKQLNLNFSNQSKLQSFTAIVRAGLPANNTQHEPSSNRSEEANAKLWRWSDKTILAYPDTYMNCSGPAVRKILDYYKISPANLYVLHDELDLGVGDWKLVFDRGAAGHNGIKSIIETLGTQAFNRFRIGINHPRNTLTPQIPVEDYVLLPFTPPEKVIIDQTIDKILPEIKNLLGH